MIFKTPDFIGGFCLGSGPKVRPGGYHLQFGSDLRSRPYPENILNQFNFFLLFNTQLYTVIQKLK